MRREVIADLTVLLFHHEILKRSFFFPQLIPGKSCGTLSDLVSGMRTSSTSETALIHVILELFIVH